MTYHIFIGYDERENEPFQVAKHSLEARTTTPIKIHRLHHKPLRECGIFTREWTVDKTGQYYCKTDNRPFSTQFSHTRFLTAHLWNSIPDKDKNPLVMFVDCDFVFLTDIRNLFSELETQKTRTQNSIPAYCVHHDYKPKTEVKMDNVVQSAYNMKLWSSLFILDMDHKDNASLTPDFVNEKDGRSLHEFSWISDKNKIGFIPESWNFIPNHSEKNTNRIDAIHWTEGGPWFDKYRNCRYGDVWWKEYNNYLKSKLLNVNFDVESMIDGR